MEQDKLTKYQDKLFKHSGDGARNLRVLGYLGAVVTLIFVGMLFSPKSNYFMIILAAGLLLTTVSYFILSKSASRGETLGLSVVSLTLGLSFVLHVLLGILTYMKTDTMPNIFVYIIWGLIIYALWVSRAQMIELEEFDLSEKAYGGKGDGKKLAIIGSIIFLVGVFSMGGGVFTQNSVRSYQKKSLILTGNKLVKIVRNEEKFFLADMQKYFSNPTSENKDKMMTGLDQLKQTVISLKNEIDEKKYTELQKVITLYLDAVNLWEKGIYQYLPGSTIDPQDTNFFELGDAKRNEALKLCDEFFLGEKVP